MEEKLLNSQGNKDDIIKIANYMKASIDRSKLNGRHEASICGLYVTGVKYKVLFMDFLYQGGYRYLEVASFNMPSNSSASIESINLFYEGLQSQAQVRS